MNQYDLTFATASGTYGRLLQTAGGFVYDGLGNTFSFGTSGAQGFQGNQGSIGESGFQGFQGIGITGSQGIQGNTGLQGLQGSQGLEGNTGFQGYQGHQGNQGISGEVGATGSPSPDVITLFIDATPDDIQIGKKAQRLIPYDCSISEWYIVAGQTGSIQFDIKKSTFSNYPTTTTIISSGPPLLNNQNKNSNPSVTGWATISSGDMIEIWVDSNTDIQNISLFLKLQ